MKKEKSIQEQGSFMNNRRLILNKNSDFVIREAYKSLRTNIRFSLHQEDCKRICITSTAAGEGKSITILNLAISIAETGKKVLLIDADMRRPAQARLLVEKATPGLSNVLVGLVSPVDAIRPDIYPNLDILFSGDVPPNPSELLGSENMERLIRDMSQHYDYVLVDTPPVNVVTDASLVANLLDGVLLLVRKDRSRKDEIKRAVENLRLAGAKLLGTVLNGATLQEKKYYKYYG